MESTAHAALPFVDTHAADFLDNPNHAIAAVGDHNTVARGPHGVEVFSYKRVESLFNDKRMRPMDAGYFSGKGASKAILDFINIGLLNFMPPERHQHVRRVMIKGFTANRIEAARPAMAAFANHLLDRLAPLGRCDFVADFSHHYSIGVISRYIGVPPEDVPTFDHATVELRLIGANPLTPGVPRLEAALASIADYVTRLIAKRRNVPGEDFVTDLIAAQAADGKFSEAELIWGIANLLLAGHDTTRYQLGSIVRSITEAKAWDELATNPSLVPKAIDEGMRLYPVTTRIHRIATEDFELYGEPVKKGEMVLLNIGAAGRDPSRFANPDKIDLHRTEEKYDIGFGHGAHYCLGHGVARTEMEEAVKAWSTRVRDVRIDGVPQITPASGGMVGPEALPISYRAR
jgi:cytochrome P450